MIKRKLYRIENIKISTSINSKRIYQTLTSLKALLVIWIVMKDKGKVILLALLDLSAAFDTVNHDILIERLQRDYGISDTAAKWFNSYLRDRDQKVVIGDAFSGAVALKTGVSQGSGDGKDEIYKDNSRHYATISPLCR